MENINFPETDKKNPSHFHNKSPSSWGIPPGTVLVCHIVYITLPIFKFIQLKTVPFILS